MQIIGPQTTHPYNLFRIPSRFRMIIHPLSLDAVCMPNPMISTSAEHGLPQQWNIHDPQLRTGCHNCGIDLYLN